MRTLLLVGRSGNGRSSVGNTILGDRNAFQVTSSSKDMNFKHVKRNNEEFVVVDCIGIGDTGLGSGPDILSDICADKDYAMKLDQRNATDVASGTCQHRTLSGDDEDETEQMESFVFLDPDVVLNEREHITTEKNDGDHIEFSNVIATEPPMFHALIFVMKYGVRFTKQEKDAVKMVKSVLGDNVFKDWGILVFTYGDNFYQDAEDDRITFESWCREQTGDLKSLFQEVNYRCVIFDNKTRVEAKQNEQRQKLKEFINKIVGENKNTHYTLSQFQQAEFSRIKEEEFKPLKRETELILRKANENPLTGDNVLDWTVELSVQLGDYYLLLNKLDDNDGNGSLTQMRDQLHDQINTLNSLLAKQKSREFPVNESSLQMINQVKAQVNHLAAYFVSLLNLGINIKNYVISFTT